MNKPTFHVGYKCHSDERSEEESIEISKRCQESFLTAIVETQEFRPTQVIIHMTTFLKYLE